MIVNTLMAAGTALIVMNVVSTLVRSAGGRSIKTALAQTVTLGVMGAILLYTEFIVLPVAVGLLLLPISAQLFAAIWFYHQGKKLLRGDFGDESMWAAEMASEEDEEFIMAADQLNKMQMREAGIEAESKDELRENVIDRAKEGQE